MITLDDLTPVDLLTPPQPLLEQALGYEPPATHDPRWVAFYWEPAHGKARYDDGRMSGDASHWAFLEWVNCPLNQELLQDYDLTSSKEGERDWLLLDRKRRAIYIARVTMARSFLRQQWPPGESVYIDPGAFYKAFRRAVDRLDAEQTEDPEAFRAKVEARTRRGQEMLQQLKVWLERAAADGEE